MCKNALIEFYLWWLCYYYGSFTHWNMISEIEEPWLQQEYSLSKHFYREFLKVYMINLEKKISSMMKNAEDQATQGLSVRRHNRRPQKTVFRHSRTSGGIRDGTGSRSETANSIWAGLSQWPRPE